MPAEQGGQRTSGINRRQLLTRGAIAGGLVWAAPVIRSTAAYATTVNGTERPCTSFFMVVINPAGQVRPAPGNTQATSIPTAIRQWFRDNPDVVVEFPAGGGLPLLTQTSDEAWAVLLPEVTGPNAAGRQCRMVIGWGRKGNKGHRFAEGYVDPNPPLAIQVGRRLIFPCVDLGRDQAETAGALSATSAVGSPIASDGTTSGATIGTDGAPSRTFTTDGTPSTDTDHGAGRCLSAVYLIFCCPR